jgi:glycine oxidase
LSQITLVIGAGAIGFSTAIELGRRGMAVTVADRGQQHGGSSWAGAGILSTLPPWSYPEEVNRLALAGMRAWPASSSEIAERAGTSPEFWTCGMHVMQTEGLQEALEWCRAHGFPAECRPDGVWLPGVSQVRNPRLLAAMQDAVISLGGRILSGCEVTGFNTENGRITSARTTRGEQSADLYVLATGAWSGLALGDVSPVPNIRPIRGQMLLYPPGGHALEHIVLQDGFYLVPRRDGHLLAGSTVEDCGFEPVTTPTVLTTLHHRACQLLPSLKQHAPIKSWAGLRPGSPDNLPIIDRHPDFENLWIHAGHFRYGVTMAPASSRLLSELIVGESPFIDPAPYSWQAALERNWQGTPVC